MERNIWRSAKSSFYNVRLDGKSLQADFASSLPSQHLRHNIAMHFLIRWNWPSVCLLAACSLARGATTYSYTGSSQTFTAPAAGLYEIIAYGAEAGLSTLNGNPGGGGVEIGAYFDLAANQTLTIYVGGGGGTFVVDASDLPLVVAGGGDGGAIDPDSGPAQTGTSGAPGTTGGIGGTSGQGGQGAFRTAAVGVRDFLATEEAPRQPSAVLITHPLPAAPAAEADPTWI
jgi:hypothetical protein